MAQSAEHILGKDEVPGSNPGISSTVNRKALSLIGQRFLILLCHYLLMIALFIAVRATHFSR